jgi:hypothetical protein
MIFQHTIDKVLSGDKTQTRRLAKPGERLLVADAYTLLKYASGRRKYRTGQTYAVQPGRGQSGIARVLITGIRQQDVRLISDEDVQAEGFAARADFVDLWREMHGENYHAWVIEFELVEDSVKEPWQKVNLADGDYYERSESGHYRLCIYETSAGSEQGYCAWQIEAWDDRLGWYIVDRDRRPVDVETAYTQAAKRLHAYDAGDLMPGDGTT